MEMRKSSRHSKITGDFAEHLTLYWLSKYGFECARVDHTGIDIIARNPYNKELMGISVKSRSRRPGREKSGILIQGEHFNKVEVACETFGCVPYFSIVADIADEIRIYIVSMEKLQSLFPLNKGLTWRMRPSFLEEYDKDPDIMVIRLRQELIKWPQSFHKKEETEAGAVFDETRTYRYSLSRTWDSSKKKVVFICLNPSTADETSNDQTLDRCLDYAKRWHQGKYGRLEIVNLFAYCTKDPDVLRNAKEPIGSKNDEHIIEAAQSADLVIVAWGENGSLLERDVEVLTLLRDKNIELHCIDFLKDGCPKHPSRARKSLNPVPFNI